MSANGTVASRLVLGTAQIGLDYGVANQRGRPNAAECKRMLSQAIERGVSRWDTARSYGDAEQRIGAFLSDDGRHADVQIVSKLPSPPDDLPHDKIIDWVTREIDTSRHNLGIDCLEGWLVHDANVVRMYGDAICDAMLAQVDRGATKQIGLSVYDLDELRLAADLQQPIAVQLPLNLLDHRFPGSIELREVVRPGSTVYARSALLQGVLTMEPSNLPAHLHRLVDPLKQLRKILTTYDVRPLDVALPFVLSHDQIDFAVVGVDDIRQLDDNLTRAELLLPAKLAEELKAAFESLPAEIVEPRRW